MVNITHIPTAAAAFIATAVALLEEFGADAVRDAQAGTATLRITAQSDGYGNITVFVTPGVTCASGGFTIAYGDDEFPPMIELRARDRRLTPAENARRALRRFVAVDKDVNVEWVNN